MSLFKISRGSSSRLDSQPFHDGYAYFTTDDGSFWIDATVDGTNKRTQINPKSNAITATLLASAWTEGSQTISVAGLTADSNGVIDVARTATDAQRSAAAEAKLSITAQAADSLTITAGGTAPSVDIPVVVLIVP